MTVKATQNFLDLEQEGETELVLVTVTYTGGRTLHRDQATVNQGHWPSFTSFSPGDPHVALIPDQGLGFWENHQDFDIDYSEEAIAEAFLEYNFLAPEIFGNKISPDIQDRVLDKLGMEYVPRNEAEIRKELAKVAGQDEDEAVEDVNEEMDFEDELSSDTYTRSELKEACRELREDSDEVSLNAGKTDFASYLAGLVADGDYDRKEIRSVIDDE